MTSSTDSWRTRLIDALIRHRLPILLASVAISLLAVFPAARLEFDQSIESLYAADDPHLTNYLESKRLFGGDELVGVVYSDRHLMEPEGLTRAGDLAHE